MKVSVGLFILTMLVATHSHADESLTAICWSTKQSPCQISIAKGKASGLCSKRALFKGTDVHYFADVPASAEDNSRFENERLAIQISDKPLFDVGAAGNLYVQGHFQAKKESYVVPLVCLVVNGTSGTEANP